MKNLFSAFFALLLPVLASAQFSVSGKITDALTNQPLPGATISIQSSSGGQAAVGTPPTGEGGQPLPGATASIQNSSTRQAVSPPPVGRVEAAADAAGKYIIPNLSAGNYTLKITYIGYQTTIKSIALKSNLQLNFSLNSVTLINDEVTVTATRAAVNSPTAYTNLNRAAIQKNNLGQDLPFLLNQTPSVVTTSDAGAGIGYTGIHIRGSDATRINVTINGIPYNDSEEQGVFFVDLPDFASSVDNIQVQRGVGTSTNGAGAFGASINIQTTTRRDTAYLELNNSAGSYGTVKNTVNIGTGLLGGHFSFDGRLSRIHSDGYIDRAWSDLKSYFFSGAYYGKNTLIRFNTFAGTEHTYQAWDGVPEDSLKAGNRTYNELGLEPNGAFYGNQTDNFTQNHYQLLVDQKISDKLSFSGALHYTKGYGYYEEYKQAQAVGDYGISPVIIGTDTINSTDLVRRLWLNNDFYGVTYNLKYQPQNNLNFTLGGAYNQFKNAHYNNIEWTQQSAGITPDYEYSRNNAQKNDFNIFGKADYRIDKVTLFADLQYRHIYYSFLGFDQDLNNVQQQVSLDFFNPKAGISYQIDPNNNLYASFAVSNHEPNRDDYINSTPQSRPRPENLKDWELGYRTNSSVFTGGINAFYMLYKNQLILTGALNDVGEQIRSNVKDSYRTGLEFDGKLNFTQQLSWAATASLSANKVKNFNQYLFNYDDNTIVDNRFKKTDIAFSPNFVGSSEISYRPVSGGEIAFISKYVSRQYLDNTSNITRSLDPYFVNGVRLNYNFSIKAVKNIGITFMINNIFSEKYEANGATYPDIEGGQVINYNYYFPQAPVNFLAALNLKF